MVLSERHLGEIKKHKPKIEEELDKIRDEIIETRFKLDNAVNSAQEFYRETNRLHQLRDRSANREMQVQQHQVVESARKDANQAQDEFQKKFTNMKNRMHKLIRLFG